MSIANWNKGTWIILALLVGVGVGGVVLVHVPCKRRLDAINHEIEAQRRALQDHVEQARVVPTMMRRVEQMKQWYKDFDRRLPRRVELGGFLREISAGLEKENLLNQAIEPGNPEREELFHTLPIIMKFRGDYPALTSFLERADRMTRLTRVRKLTVCRTKEQDALDIELQLNIYFTES